ncbi:MAG: PCMD domain-containing protein [Rikenellaceae bacterium]|nr:PCMD domain-containing protein [Rikenellaceae bacterium]
MKRFKYMAHITGWVVSLALLAQVTGCTRSDLGAGEGTISFAFEQDDAVRVKGTNSLRDDIGYTLDIVDQKGDTVAHYDDHRTVRSIKLKEGVYTVYAEDNNETPEASTFGEPRYGGAESVTVKAGQNTPVVMVCKIANVKVLVTDFEQAIKDNFPEYSLVVKPTEDYAGRDTLTFTQTEADAGQEGWINQTKKGTFVLIFRAVNRQSPDKRQIYIRTIADAEPGDFYRFSVKMNPVGDPSDGGTMFRLSVKTDTKEYEFPFGVKDQTRPLPVVSRADGISIREPLVTNVDTRNGQIKVNIHADAGIQRLRIRHEDATTLLKYGLPGMVNLGGDNDMAADEAQRTALAGLVTWHEGTVVGVTDTWIDFSGLMNTAKLDGALLPEGIYPVDIEVYDFDNQLVTQTISLSVARDFSNGIALTSELVNGIPGVGAKYAYVTAKWLGTAAPTGLGFQYRVLGSGDDAWQTVSVQASDVDQAQKSFRCLLTGLEPNTLYEYRPVGDDLAPGSISAFSTGIYTDISGFNFGFDEWAQSGKTWYPASSASYVYWATGNEGVTSSAAGGFDSNTAPTSDVAVEGTRKQAAKLTSVGGVSMVDHAAGNLFCGSFKTNIDLGNLVEGTKLSPKFGRPFSGRPIYFEGYFKYISTNITYGGKGNVTHDELKGTPDQCQIYISLEHWGSASSRPLSYNMASLDHSSVVGFAQLHTVGETNMADYVHFVLPIQYDPAKINLAVDHIVIVATSSRWGGDFCGGNGSTLYVDEFNLGWDFPIPASGWVQPAD